MRPANVALAPDTILIAALGAAADAVSVAVSQWWPTWQAERRAAERRAAARDRLTYEERIAQWTKPADEEDT